MRLRCPTSLGECLTLLAETDGAIPVAGGTDLMVHWPQRLDAHLGTYVDLSSVTELRTLSWSPECLVIGAGTTYWDVIQDPQIGAAFPLLVAAARQIGAIQIQARGTWAGNIANASPAADGVPVLMAYGASIVLASSGERVEIPLDEFYLDYKKMRRRPDQLITEIRIPRRRYDVERFEKIGGRRAQAITKVGLALTREHDAWRVVAGSVAPTVTRCPALERALAGGVPSAPEDLLAAIRQDVSPIDDVRSTARYRETVMARVLYHLVIEALSEDPSAQ